MDISECATVAFAICPIRSQEQDEGACRAKAESSQPFSPIKQN